MKKADTWMPWYVGKYLADTLNLNTEQHGAYCLLLMACWKGGGVIANNDSELSSITKLPPAKWRAHRAVLLKFFVIDGENLTHERVVKERLKAIALSEKRSKTGRDGAEKRWQKDSKPMANAIPETSQSDGPLPLPNTSEPYGSGASAPQDSRDWLFSVGLAMLTSTGHQEQQARRVIGKWCRDYTDEATIKAMQDVSSRRPADVVSAVMAKLTNKPSKRGNDWMKDWANELTGNTESGNVIEGDFTPVH